MHTHSSVYKDIWGTLRNQARGFLTQGGKERQRERREEKGERRRELTNVSEVEECSSGISLYSWVM